MATVIDRLVVSLGLDATEFEDGKKKAHEGLKDVRDDAEKTGKSLDAEGKTGAQFFGRLTKGALTLFGVLAGASSFTEFIRMNAAASASTGRFAANIGSATKDLSIWQEIVKQSGGVASDADTAFNNLAQTFWNMRVLGDMSMAGDLQALGLTASDLENQSVALSKLAAASDKFERSDYYRRLQRLGIPDSVINTLVKGRGEVERLTDAQEKLGFITDEDAKKAQELEKAWADAASGATDFARDLATQLTPTLIGVANWIKDITPAVREMGEAFAGWMNGLTESAANKEWYKFWTDLIGLKVREDSPLAELHKRYGGSTVDNIHLSPGKSFLDFGAGPRSAGRNTPVKGSHSAEQIFIDAGYTPAQARGIIAGAYAESRLDPRAFNSAGGGRGARGIGQWRGKRLDDFKRVMGKDVLEASADEQYRFMVWELQNTERNSGKRIKAAKTPDDALSSYIVDYMRPAQGAETMGDFRRGREYIRGAGATAGNATNINVSGPITITTQATDARGVAREFVPALNAVAVSNANRGIVP